jgi:hypothetical protein
MNKLKAASKRLKVAHDRLEQHYRDCIAAQDELEIMLTKRMAMLNERKQNVHRAQYSWHTTMVTTRSTMCASDDCMLAKQYDDSKWTEKDSSTLIQFNPYCFGKKFKITFASSDFTLSD